MTSSLTTSSGVKNLEKFCGDLINRKKDKELRVEGPSPPSKVLKVTTREMSFDEGSKTWDRYELKVHTRWFNLNSTSEVVKQIISDSPEAAVVVEITIAN